MLKLSSNKVSAPGRKQVFRGEHGDVIGLRDEPVPDGHQPLLIPVMLGGERSGPHRNLETARGLFRSDLERLAPQARRIHDPEPPEAAVSDALARLTEETRADALRRAGVG